MAGSSPASAPMSSAAGRPVVSVQQRVAGFIRAAGGGFRLWDGSSRRIRASLDVGAVGLDATPLCAFDADPAERRTLARNMPVSWGGGSGI